MNVLVVQGMLAPVAALFGLGAFLLFEGKLARVGELLFFAGVLATLMLAGSSRLHLP